MLDRATQHLPGDDVERLKRDVSRKGDVDGMTALQISHVETLK